MKTKIIIHCIEKALEDIKVQEAIEKREQSPNARIEEVSGKILKQIDNHDTTKLLVRVGFDFQLKVDNSDAEEDILVNVLYTLDKSNNGETYQIKNKMLVPEID